MEEMTQQIKPVDGATYTASTSDTVHLEPLGVHGFSAWVLRGTINELDDDTMYIIAIHGNKKSLLDHAQCAGVVGRLKVVYHEHYYYVDNSHPRRPEARPRFVVETAEPITN